jgi:hypothetical protein
MMYTPVAGLDSHEFRIRKDSGLRKGDALGATDQRPKSLSSSERPFLHAVL